MKENILLYLMLIFQQSDWLNGRGHPVKNVIFIYLSNLIVLFQEKFEAVILSSKAAVADEAGMKSLWGGVSYRMYFTRGQTEGIRAWTEGI